MRRRTAVIPVLCLSRPEICPVPTWVSPSDDENGPGGRRVWGSHQAPNPAAGAEQGASMAQCRGRFRQVISRGRGTLGPRNGTSWAVAAWASIMSLTPLRAPGRRWSAQSVDREVQAGAAVGQKRGRVRILLDRPWGWHWRSAGDTWWPQRLRHCLIGGDGLGLQRRISRSVSGEGGQLGFYRSGAPQ